MNSLVLHPLSEAIGWALLHSLWQGALLVILAHGAIWALRSRSPGLNTAIHTAALGAVLLWFGITVAQRLQPATDGIGDRAGLRLSEPPRIEPTETISQAGSKDTLAPRTLLPGLVTAWAIGVFLMGLRLLAGLARVRRLRLSAVPWTEPGWQEKLSRWLKDLAIERPVRLCLTGAHEIPAVIGHFKPVVLLPAAIVTRLSPEQLEAVILHELMHIRRNDYLINLLQVCAETLLFFNPSIWWLSRAARLERELACDQLAADYAGDRLRYAKALVRIEELRMGEAAALALAVSGGSLKKRVLRLLAADERQSALAGWAGFGYVALILVLACLNFWPRTIAQENQGARLEIRSVVAPGTANGEVLPFKKLGEARADSPQDYTVAREVLLDNRHFARVEVTHDPLANRPEISVRLTPEGAALFSRITQQHVGKQLAIVIDRSIVSAPVVNERIPGGSFNISGSFTEPEARELARKLMSSSLEKNTDSRTQIELPGWAPPDGTLPSRVWEEAKAERAAGRYQEALARHVWYHTASRNEPGQGGVRLSFALSDWVALGHDYVPALQKLKEIRDQTGQAVRTVTNEADPFILFQEYAGINWALSEEEKTVELFRWLDQNRPEIARMVYPVAQGPMIAAKDYQLCPKYLDVNALERQWQNLKDPNERRKKPFSSNLQLERQLHKETAKLIALLVLTGNEEKARELATWGLQQSSEPSFQKLVAAALDGKMPNE